MIARVEEIGGLLALAERCHGARRGASEVGHGQLGAMRVFEVAREQKDKLVDVTGAESLERKRHMRMQLRSPYRVQAVEQEALMECVAEAVAENPRASSGLGRRDGRSGGLRPLPR